MYYVNVGTTNPAQELEFKEWSGQQAALNGQDGTFITNGKINSDNSIPPWNPGVVQAGEKIEYSLLLVNTGQNDREECVVGFMDYRQIPLQNNDTLICGIIKANKSGSIKASFIAPSQPGNHHFQLVSIENPLMKDSYYNKIFSVYSIPLAPVQQVIIQVR